MSAIPHPEAAAPPPSDLLAEILAFNARYGIAETRFGFLAVRSYNLVNSIRQGRKPRPRTEARIRAFMALGDPGAPAPYRPRSSEDHALAVRRNQDEHYAASEFRRTDPVERAKTYIRSRGWHCFEAAITRPELNGQFFIGHILASRDELLSFAKRRGWAG